MQFSTTICAIIIYTKPLKIYKSLLKTRVHKNHRNDRKQRHRTHIHVALRFNGELLWRVGASHRRDIMRQVIAVWLLALSHQQRRAARALFATHVHGAKFPQMCGKHALYVTVLCTAAILTDIYHLFDFLHAKARLVFAVAVTETDVG